MKYTFEKITIGLLRISLGGVFLWSFLDKTFGLGFATEKGKSWLDGASPTFGYLTFGSRGIFHDFFVSLAGNQVVDVLFMLGMLLIGVSLILGVGIRIAAVSGAFLMLLIYFSAFPPENNPFIDEHIVYILLLLLFAATNAQDRLGFGKWWARQTLVKKYPFLR